MQNTLLSYIINKNMQYSAIRNVCLSLMSVVVACSEPKQSPKSEDELNRVPFISTETNAEKDFLLYLPEGYHNDVERDWPVILFLHGNGERGNSQSELGFVLKHGPLYEAWVQKRALPFIIVSPQLPMFGMDTLGISYLQNRELTDFPDRLAQGTPERDAASTSDQKMNGAVDVSIEELHIPPLGWERVEEDLLTIVEQVLKDYRADPTRLYITGLSYGGFGTWYMASKHPQMFAAASPVVGWGHPDLMGPIADENMPIWVISGGRDNVVQKKYFLPGLNKLEALGHTNLRYTIHEDMGHDTWKRVYAGEDLYSWFLEHRR